eukprot:Sspe_Gene.64518::Locus_38237_Transcript_1_1_Confidence_1.000_Length_840::g.64518::m.64518
MPLSEDPPPIEMDETWDDEVLPAERRPRVCFSQVPWLTVAMMVVLVAVSVFTTYIIMQSQFHHCPSHMMVNDLHMVYTRYLEGAKYIDLTHTIEPAMPLWPAFAPPSVAGGQAGKRIE